MADELNKDNGNGAADGAVIEEVKQRGATGSFVDRLMKEAVDAGIKINKGGENGDKPTDPPAKPAEPAKPADKKFDYSIFKNIDDKDYKDVDAYLAENKITNPAIRHRMASHIDDIKKNQRLVAERTQRIQELEKAGVKEVEVDRKFADAIDGLKKDFFGTYSKLQDEHKLPDITSIAKMISSGNTLQAQIAQYQSDTLIPELEKKHNIEAGTFVFDASEAWKAGTPSYEYRTKTADKENELRGSWQRKNDEVATSAAEMIKVRNDQIKELKDSYFPVNMKDDGSEEYKQAVEEQDKKYTDMLGRLDSVYETMKQGKALQPSENPFIFKNVFRGLFYDELSRIDINRAVQKVHEQYAKHGLRLPKSEMPEDVTRLKGESPDGESGTFKVGDTRFSPQNRFLNRVKKQLNN